MKLNNIYISSFRGATKPVTIDFDPSKKITMIFAENGNGKSTIADAFICLLTENRGSLDDKSSIDPQFIKSLGTGTGETKITLNTDTGTYSASLSGTAKDFTKTPATGLPPLRFLRRSQIINIMNLKPSERYNSLKDYIDVSSIYASEEELRKTNREVDSELENSVRVLASAKDTLEQAWIKEGKPQGDIMVWAKAQAEMDLSKDKVALQTLKVLTNEWRAIDNKYKEILGSIGVVKASQTAFNNATEALKKLQAESINNNASLFNLLQQAKTYIAAKDPITNCPVCSSDIDKTEVLNSLNKQIASMDALGKAAKLVDDTKKVNDRNIAIQNKAVETFSTLLIKYKNSIAKYKTEVPDIAPFVDTIGTDISANYTCFTANITPLTALFDRIEKSEKQKSKAIEQHSLIKTQFDTITLQLNKSEKLGKLAIAVSKALVIVEKERKDYYDNELLSISGEVEQMYQKIHPKEGLGGIKLFLNPKFKTSLELQANFHTEEGITPQSVYSESHLDTLGICIFLALAKKYSTGDTILVLDDVVMSVDDKHLDRFIDLLHDEEKHFGQIIITTHYRPWRERYRNNRAPAGNVQFLELRNWSKENGIRVFNSKIILDELKHLLADEAHFHRENIAGTAGRMLENLLDYITLKYSSRLPRKPKADYQLHELLTGLSKELLKVFRVEHFSKDENGKYTVLSNDIPLVAVIDKLKQLKAVRNQVGAHFNFDGQLVSDDDVIEFGTATVEFAELLICAETGALPDKDNSGSYWETKSGSIKLYPLVDPK